jgi:hypothetical protein
LRIFGAQATACVNADSIAFLKLLAMMDHFNGPGLIWVFGEKRDKEVAVLNKK